MQLSNGQIFNSAIHCQHIPRQVLLGRTGCTASKAMQTALRAFKLQSHGDVGTRAAMKTIYGDKENKALATLIFIADCYKHTRVYNFAYCHTDFKRALRSVGIYNYHQQHHAWRPNIEDQTDMRFLELVDIISKLTNASLREYEDMRRQITFFYTTHRSKKFNLDPATLPTREVIQQMLGAIEILSVAYKRFGLYMTYLHLDVFGHRYPKVATRANPSRYRFAIENGLVDWNECEKHLDAVRALIPHYDIMLINTYNCTKRSPEAVTGFFN